MLGHSEDKTHKGRVTKVWECRINKIPWSKEENKLIKELFDNLKASYPGKMQLQRAWFLEADKQECA